MADAKLMKRAQKVYNTLCLALDSLHWSYTRHENDLVVTLGVSGDDIPMGFVIAVDAERQLIRCLSQLNVKFNKNNAPIGNIACCHFTFKLNDGSFDYDYKENTVTFRITASFLDSLISEELILYLIATACNTVDDYNHHFDALANDKMTLEELLDI